MTVQAGNFFPPEYKTFPFVEGDLLVSQRTGGKFAVNKILKVDRFDLPKGSSINIQGKTFVATEDDFLLIVSTAFGDSQFGAFEEAQAAALSGCWTVKLAHAPNRSPGAAVGQTRVGNEPVTDAELEGYRAWREAFDRDEAGIF